eukprot:5717233-Amphidinium_carterae.1
MNSCHQRLRRYKGITSSKTGCAVVLRTHVLFTCLEAESWPTFWSHKLVPNLDGSGTVRLCQSCKARMVGCTAVCSKLNSRVVMLQLVLRRTGK